MTRRGLPLIFSIIALAAIGCGGPTATADSSKTDPKAKSAPVEPGLTELKIMDTKPGNASRKVEVGDRVYVTYRGTLKNGTVFDANDEPSDDPFSFVIAGGAQGREVIEGWDTGLIGMGEGGQRRLEIPAKLAYGDQVVGQIPANSDLYFDITLHAIVKKGEENVFDSVDVKAGTGRELKSGDRAVIHYTGKLANGKMIDSTYDRKQTVEFVVGGGRVLRGVDAGVVGMRVGGKRRLTLPPNIAYGASGQMYVPVNSVLIYEIELVAIR